MSETMATRITTVSRVSRHSRVRALWPVLLAAATAETARRVLAPRAPALQPVRVDVQTYFSAEEIDRGRRHRRPLRPASVGARADAGPDRRRRPGRPGRPPARRAPARRARRTGAGWRS